MYVTALLSTDFYPGRPECNIQEKNVSQYIENRTETVTSLLWKIWNGMIWQSRVANISFEFKTRKNKFYRYINQTNGP